MDDEIGLIEKLNRRYRFKIKELPNNTCYIDSGKDEWIVEFEEKQHPEHKNIVLKHKNWKRDVDRYHIQRRFYDVPYMMNAIQEHEDKWFRMPRSSDRILELCNQLEKERNDRFGK